MATDIIATTTHPNRHAMLMPTLLLISPLDRVHRHGQTKIPTKTAINITMANTWLTRLRSDDPLHGQSSPLPPQSFLSITPVLHPGPSYPIAFTQPHKTTETPNVGSRQSPGSSRMKFLFSSFCLLTITHNNNPDICTLLYPIHHTPTSTSHHSLTLTTSPFCSPTSQICCVRAHTETSFARFRLFREGHLWQCYLRYQPPRTL
jgi:hypothetical protein